MWYRNDMRIRTPMAISAANSREDSDSPCFGAVEEKNQRTAQMALKNGGGTATVSSTCSRTHDLPSSGCSQTKSFCPFFSGRSQNVEVSLALPLNHDLLQLLQPMTSGRGFLRLLMCHANFSCGRLYPTRLSFSVVCSVSNPLSNVMMRYTTVVPNCTALH